MNHVERQNLQKSIEARGPRVHTEVEVASERNINWHITNYPPILRAFHWNLAEVNKEASIICFVQRIVFFIATLVGLWNMIQAYEFVI